MGMPKHPLTGFQTQNTLLPDMREVLSVSVILGVMVLFFAVGVSAQSPQPYPNAVTDRLIHPKTPMLPPPVNSPFTDPDFGSTMVRVTDQTSNFLHPGGYLRTEASGTSNMWSADTSKFYVIGEGGLTLVYGFNPSTMNITSLPNARPGQALHVPLRDGASFSFVDPDLIYGTTNANRLSISSYRFSTAAISTVVDTTTCGAQPPIIAGSKTLSDDDVTSSLDDNRIAISEGGASVTDDIFVIVYDRTLGCRWYNTQTGQIGGQWGPSGNATFTGSYFVQHAHLSRSGNYVHIFEVGSAWYVWDLTTLTVTHCPLKSNLDCAGYTGIGYNDLVNSPGKIDGMNIVKRPLSDISQFTQLVWPLSAPHYWGQDKHFTWSNVDVNDSAPVCASSYLNFANGSITQPFEGEIFCVETDGVVSTVWRFAHNRATWYPGYFNTQPLGSISRDGTFYLFSSNWDDQLGTESDGTERSDVWIVKLD
jgi:hypothetical protein